MGYSGKVGGGIWTRKSRDVTSHVMPQAVSSHVMLQGATVTTQMFLNSNLPPCFSL
jgi:hypothetical protein